MSGIERVMIVAGIDFVCKIEVSDCGRAAGIFRLSGCQDLFLKRKKRKDIETWRVQAVDNNSNE